MENQEYKFCTKCGAKIQKDAKFCTVCGTQLFAELKADEKLVEEQVENTASQNVEPKNGIVLHSEAPFENKMEPLNKGYIILGVVGGALGFVFGNNLGAVCFLALFGMFLWWVIKANIALGKWRNLREYRFWLGKQLPPQELTGKLVRALAPYGIRVDVSQNMPEIVYKNVTIQVVYNSDGTFSMPWRQKLGFLFFDGRYITSYLNTVSAMSIIGYNIQKIGE